MYAAMHGTICNSTASVGIDDSQQYMNVAVVRVASCSPGMHLFVLLKVPQC
jgi:hypothetical protein